MKKNKVQDGFNAKGNNFRFYHFSQSHQSYEICQKKNQLGYSYPSQLISVVWVRWRTEPNFRSDLKLQGRTLSFPWIAVLLSLVVCLSVSVSLTLHRHRHMNNLSLLQGTVDETNPVCDNHTIVIIDHAKSQIRLIWIFAARRAVYEKYCCGVNIGWFSCSPSVYGILGLPGIFSISLETGTALCGAAVSWHRFPFS